MRLNKGSIVFSIIIVLAMIGLISYVGNSPGRFLLNILVIAVVAAVLFFVLRAVMNRRSQGNSGEMKKYRQAVKQSKQKYNGKEEKPKYKSKQGASFTFRKKRRNRPHLTVIDGKKNTNKQKNDRASN